MGAALSLFDLTRRSKPGMYAFLAMAILAIIWTAHIFGPPPRQVVQQKFIPYAQKWIDRVSPSRISTFDLSHLQPHVRTAEFSYARRTIRTKFYEGERPDLTRINETLFGAPHVLEKTNLTTIEIDALQELTLHVPRSPNVDLTCMSFGMATDTSRLKQSMPQVMHWLNNTDAQLHVLAPPSNDDLAVEREIRATGLNLTITTNELTFAKRYFSILKTLYDYRTPSTKWLVYMDDDTFLPSLPYLIAHFQKYYDHTEEMMVAAISDNINQVKNFGLIPFGGGGIFVSVPLAESLLQPAVFAKCLDTGRDQGDQIVNDCLNNYSKVRPTWDLGLNQMDINGDVSGYFESGRRMLTMHHWKTWFNVDVPGIANVSAACGNECILQRWQFDDNIVLSNGYSIQEYPNGIEGEEGVQEGEGVDLNAVERTWGGENEQWKHHIGPLREPLKSESKRQYRMVETVPDESGRGIRQVYVEVADEDKKMDRVVELLWLF